MVKGSRWVRVWGTSDDPTPPRPSGRTKPCEGMCGGEGGEVEVTIVNAYDKTNVRTEMRPCPDCGGSGQVPE